jgi:phospholipid transport system substrate-binding protein
MRKKKFHLLPTELKIRRFTCLFILFCLIASSRTATAFPTPQTPARFVLALLSTVKQLKKSDPDKKIILTSEDKKRNGELGRQINQMVDLNGISKYALQKHWSVLDDQQRKAFVELFTELLAKVAYPNAGKFLSELEVSVRKEKKRNQKVMVYTSVIHKEEGRIDIDFKLASPESTDSTWIVLDVYLDGVSLVRNLRTQCLKIIRDNSYEELLNRMKTKIATADTSDLKEVTGRE